MLTEEEKAIEEKRAEILEIVESFGYCLNDIPDDVLKRWAVEAAVMTLAEENYTLTRILLEFATTK